LTADRPIRYQPNDRFTRQQNLHRRDETGIARIVGVIGIAACLVLSGTASAQSTKGAGGKVSISFIKWPVVNIQAKAGSFSSKPAASVAGKPPTGGTSAALKFAKEISDPLKPGLAAGDYVL
jgi:hypothetical protein